MKKIKDLCLRFLAIPFTILCLACSSSGSDALAQDDTPPVAENEVLPDVFAPDYWDTAELVWKDDFDGDALSSENWSFETGANGWGNNEWQDYVANDNVEVSNGT
ncbi:MAG: hypothetical protein WBN39_12460, partial [Flavobacteriaceae bacterium]